MSRTHNLFFSHTWKYGYNYDNLQRLLSAKPYFFFKDYSVPQNDPIHTNGTDKQLYDAIYSQMYSCGIIIILAGVDASYSKWIGKEIEIAKQRFTNPKPIIAVEPWGAEKTSAVVKNHADRIVRWNTDSIVSAIRELD